MSCIKNGVNVRYATDGTHAYSGDLFKCDNCNISIVNTGNTNPHHNKNHNPNDIYMHTTYNKIMKKHQKINLR